MQSVLKTDPGKEHDNGTRLKAQKRTSLGSSEPNVRNYRPRCNTGLLSRLDRTTSAASRLRSKNSVTNVASRTLLMVFLTQNSVCVLKKLCCHTSCLLSIQNISAVCSWIFKEITGPVFLTKHYILNAITRRYQI